MKRDGWYNMDGGQRDEDLAKIDKLLANTTL